MSEIETDISKDTTLPITRPILFAQNNNVRQLKESDFSLDKRELICINFDDCMTVLFYSNNKESQELCKIWASAASQSVGTIFCACHLDLEKKVADNFNRLNEVDRAHPLYWARLQGYPFIMVYRQGWPAAMYNGSRTTQSILDFALSLACNPNYVEKINSFKSTTADENLDYNEPNYTTTEKTVSTEFTKDSPIRKIESTTKEEVIIKTATSKGDIAMPIKKKNNQIKKNETII